MNTRKEELEESLHTAEVAVRETLAQRARLDFAIVQTQDALNEAKSRFAEVRQQEVSRIAEKALQGGVTSLEGHQALRNAREVAEDLEMQLEGLMEARAQADSQLLATDRQLNAASLPYNEAVFAEAVEEFEPAAQAFLEACRRLFGVVTECEIQSGSWLGKLHIPDPRNELLSLGRVLEPVFSGNDLIDAKFTPNPETADYLQPFIERRQLLNQSRLEALKIREQQRIAS